MGLIDEAIAEFQLAAKDEARILECSSMLGICFLEKGMPKLAVKWFEKGLKAPGRSDDEYAALRYDLAAAHEAAGEVDRALSLFTDLYGQDANFRDVAAKVRELGAALRGAGGVSPSCARRTWPRASPSPPPCWWVLSWWSPRGPHGGTRTTCCRSTPPCACSCSARSPAAASPGSGS